MLLQDLTEQIVAGGLPLKGPDVGTPFESKATGTGPADLLLLLPLPLPLPFGERAAMAFTMVAIIVGSIALFQAILAGADPWCKLSRAFAEARCERMRSLCLTRLCRRCHAGSAAVAPTGVAAEKPA